MKRVICDTCRKELEPDTNGLAPWGSGWVEVLIRDGAYGRQDYCSKACAVTALSLRPATIDVIEPARRDRHGDVCSPGPGDLNGDAAAGRRARSG